MIIKYNTLVSIQTLQKNIKRMTNQVYKLLPMRQEGADWEKPLQTLIEQLAGMNRLLLGQNKILFTLLCKMEGLLALEDSKDFLLYRRVIFECLGLLNTFLNEIKENEKL